MQIETRLLERSGSAITFETRLPKPQSDLARETLKDPYRFDFLGLTDEAQERDVEQSLVKHVTEFLLELGAALYSWGGSVAGCGRRRFSLICFSITLSCAAMW